MANTNYYSNIYITAKLGKGPEDHVGFFSSVGLISDLIVLLEVHGATKLVKNDNPTVGNQRVQNNIMCILW